MNPVDIALPVVGGLALEDEWASRPASSSIPSSNPILADSGKDLDPIDYDEVDWYYPPDVGSSNSDVSYLDLNETVEELLLYETGYGSDNNSDVSHLDLDNGGEEESGDSYALATLSGVVRNCGLGHDKVSTILFYAVNLCSCLVGKFRYLLDFR